MSAAACSPVVQPLKKTSFTRHILEHRTPLILSSQVVLLFLSYYLSFLLRLDFRLDAEALRAVLLSFPIVFVVKLAMFRRFGLLRGWWCYVGLSDAVDLAKAALLSAAILFLILEYWLHFPGYPRSVLGIDFIATVTLVGGARCAVRAYTETVQHCTAERNTLIVGAAHAGRSIARELNRDSELRLRPVGFIDDNPSKRGIRIDGLPVFGPTTQIAEFIRKLGVECVLIASRAAGADVERIVSKCRECRVEFKILPSIREHINGKSSLSGIRSVLLEDLLGRQPVSIDLGSIRHQLNQKVLLITGAGGSIGSELARQIATFGPRELVLVDRSENCLFKLGMELSARIPEQRFVPVVADIQDVRVMRDVFSAYRPEVVFHAAAYKHVPMMERNCFQAISNNVFGTYNVALLARQFGANSFVMISSDKSVNPANIMGVTKRVAELIMLGLQGGTTRFVAVRFGNVLGSNGSVVPTFQKQIAAGGPVTVTHPDAKRYFMTIPEAVRLVLQAFSMGQGGEIFVLDMGTPMKILDLAHNLIRLSGLEPDKDIPIVFTGLRPGEKLTEELTFVQENIKPTTHDKVRMLATSEVTRFAQVQKWLDELSTAVEARNVSALIATLQQIVPEYQPSEQIRALGEVDRHDLSLIYRKERARLWYAAQDAA
jgi:FlaA1/EpsC-like NDP-sugar epimerase